MELNRPIIFDCIDGYTAGNPVRLVKTPKPILKGNSMLERRSYFQKHYDWIRKGLVFEPRGHDLMSGGFYYPPINPENDVAILFIETSGCLPMCGHGLIGIVTMLLERNFIKPKRLGLLKVETPAGLVKVYYQKEEDKVVSVKFNNVPSFLCLEGIKVNTTKLGQLTVDVAFGGNFYAIVDRQENYVDMSDYTVSELIGMGRELRSKVSESYQIRHPINLSIEGCSHVLWTGTETIPQAHARNAVLYGEKSIDRSPCGTGTCARMAQLYAKGKLTLNSPFVHESIIGSTFTGTILEETMIKQYRAIVPSIEGSATITGYNKIILDPKDPYVEGFQVI